MMRRIALLALSAVLLLSCSSDKAPVSLKTEGRVNPEGIEKLTPRFSWENSAEQTSYRIQIAKSERGLSYPWSRVWDSGKIESDQSVMVCPQGMPELEKGTSYWWRVKTDSGAWSTPAYCSTGIDSTMWADAVWIGVDENVGDNESHLPARYLRTQFDVENGLEEAKLYFCGLGMGVVTVNGVRVDENVFAHPPTLFSKTVYYRTYDVTRLLSKGDNCLGVILGCGRYQTSKVWYLHCVSDPRMKLCLRMKYRDGKVLTLVSDASWMATSAGPILSNNEFHGEHYDARKEMPGWDRMGFECNSVWKNADVMPAPGGVMEAMPMDDMAVQELVVPTTVTALSDGRCIVDMGINMVGYVKVRLRGRSGKPVVMKFAEHLNASRDSVDMANLRAAEATDIYIPASDSVFEWTPLFPYHGFRYVEISGLEELPSVEDLTGCVIYDKMETLGSFECSDERLNALYANMFRGIRSNYRGMPTDCPQRDERQGWLGDRGATVWSEPYVFGCDRLYLKWMRDVYDSMHRKGRISIVSPKNWTIYNNDMAASVVFLYMADMLYTRFGDDSGIVTYYPAMKKWFDYVTEANLHDGIFTMKRDEYCDWCCPPESLELIHSQDPARQTESEVIQTAVLMDAIRYMRKFALMTGNEADVPALDSMAEEVKKAYNERFFDTEGARYSNNTQTANLMALAMGIVPQERRQDVVDNLVNVIENRCDGHLAVGNVGVRYLMQTLTHNGYEQLAYRLATQDTYPGWGYMLSKGATTIWELWNGDTADSAMNSENHVMMIGDLLSWYYEDLAGIRCASDAVGFDKVEMAPCFPEGLDWVKASHKTPYGVLSSEWHRNGESLSWNITVPPHTVAAVRIPLCFNISAEGLEKEESDGCTLITLTSGTYHLR